MRFPSILVSLIVGFVTLASSTFAKGIEAYFNHDESYAYTDPYRGIHRKGQDLEQVIIRTIKSAKSSVYVAVQELRLPLVAKALVEMKSKGVDVKIILEDQYNKVITDSSKLNEDEANEHDYSKYSDISAFVDVNQDNKFSHNELMDRDAIYILRENGIPTRDDRFDGSYGSGLMHHKFIIVDNQELLISSANFTMSGVHGDFLKPKSRGNANSMIKIKSAALSKRFLKEFLLMWGEDYNSKFGLAKPYRGALVTRGANLDVISQFSPSQRDLGHDKSTNGTIGRLLGEAKKEVQMALFVFSDQNIANALRKNQTANSDLDISILVDRNFATRSYSELLDLWGIQLRADKSCHFEFGNLPWRRPVKKAGIPRLADGDMLHHKFAVIDEEFVIMGSHNWSDSANHINDENIIVIKDREIAKKYKKEFTRLIRGARLGPSKNLLRKIQATEQKCRA